MPTSYTLLMLFIGCQGAPFQGTHYGGCVKHEPGYINEQACLHEAAVHAFYWNQPAVVDHDTGDVMRHERKAYYRCKLRKNNEPPEWQLDPKYLPKETKTPSSGRNLSTGRR
jgi:hypothetical protein